MRRLKGNSKGDKIFYGIFLLFFVAVIIGSELPIIKIMSISFPIILTVFIFLSISQFYFMYDKNRIIIKNSIWKFLHYEYNVVNIKRVKLTADTQLGGGVRIFFVDGRKKFFYTNVPKDSIISMLENLDITYES